MCGIVGYVWPPIRERSPEKAHAIGLRRPVFQNFSGRLPLHFITHLSYMRDLNILTLKISI